MTMKSEYSWKYARCTAYGALALCVALGGLLGGAPWAELKAQGTYATVDLGLSAAAAVPSAQPGGTFDFRYSISNAGPSAAHDVVLVTPGNKQFQVVSTSGCLEDPVPAQWCTVNLPNGALPSSHSISIMLTMAVSPKASSPLVIESMVSAIEPDHNRGNEHNSTTVPVN